VPPRITPSDVSALAEGVNDLVGELRHLSDEQGKVAGETRRVTEETARLAAGIDLLRADIATLRENVNRLENQHHIGALARVLGTLERAPWQVGALLVVILLVGLLLFGHVDIVALTQAYGGPKP
jgi:septal ring factor EnvC (AmiA/AmiB activator)